MMDDNQKTIVWYDMHCHLFSYLLPSNNGLSNHSAFGAGFSNFQLPSALVFRHLLPLAQKTKLKPWGDRVILTVHCLRKTGLQCIVTPYDRYLIAIHHHLCNVIVTAVAIAITTHTVLYKAMCCSSTDTVPHSTVTISNG